MHNNTSLSVIKIGGNVIDNPPILNAFLKDFSLISTSKILIHGGGKVADVLLKKLSIEPIKIQGRRVTDADTLDVVTMVYAGLINKKIVAQLHANGCNALGVSGADLNLIKAHKRAHPTLDYGFVGDIDAVSTEGVVQLLRAADTLVFAPITHDGNGQLLNTNADTIAATLAVALSVWFDVTLNYVFEKKGVLADVNDEDSVIPHLNFNDYEKGKSDGTFFEGMIPKLDNAFNALKAGVQRVVIRGTHNIHQPNGTVLSLI
jgi:acetylglutamate kinase